MKNDKLALRIGRQVLTAYNQWTEDPRGKCINIPLRIESRSDSQDWCMTIQCDMPWFMEGYWENGERKFKHWSLKEWVEHTSRVWVTPQNNTKGELNGI